MDRRLISCGRIRFDPAIGYAGDILESVAGKSDSDLGAIRYARQRATLAALVRLCTLQKAGDRGSAGWLYKDAFLRCEPTLSCEDLIVRDNVHHPLRFKQGCLGPRSAGRISDTYRRGCGFGALNYPVIKKSSGTGSLKTDHPRGGSDAAQAMVFGVSFPISRNVSCITNRQDVRKRGFPERICNLECSRFLAFQSIGINRVHYANSGLIFEFANDPEAGIKISVDRNDLGATDESLRQLSQGDISRRYKHCTSKPSTSSVSGSRSRGITSRSADQGRSTTLDRFADGDGHSTVFERSGRVQPFILQKDLTPIAQERSQLRRLNQRSRTFTQRYYRSCVRNRK